MMDKKSYAKIDPTGKLHIIYSLDNGQAKADIARVYGVHPQTIAYIYRQKELILKKYSKKYNQLKEVCCINLDQSLLEWFKVQTSNQIEVTEEHLMNKAQEIIENLDRDLIDIDDWLLDFRLRHNIVKFSPEIQNSADSLKEWKNKLNIGTEELYIGGTCAVAHSYSIEALANGDEPDNYMSIFFVVQALASNKIQIAVVGRAQPMAEYDIGSLPVNYYCNNGQVNQHVILNQLKHWDAELASKEKMVILALHIPENCYLSNKKFSNIRIIHTNMQFVSNSTKSIVECFKFHYRKLQITRKLEHGCDFNFGHLDYINMISLAWFSVPQSHMKQICCLLKEGSLYLQENDACDGTHSLLLWCQQNNLSLELDLYRHCLDDYIHCDRDLKSMDYEAGMESVSLNLNPKTVMGMEAHQAMKRLLSYVQGEHAQEHVLMSARNLENHFEHEALSEVHRIIKSTSME